MVCFLCSSSMSSSLLVETTVRGYHIYQVLWESQVWEGFFVLHEKEDRHNKHVVAVYQDKEPLVIVGHMPQERLLRYTISSQSTMVKSWEK